MMKYFLCTILHQQKPYHKYWGSRELREMFEIHRLINKQDQSNDVEVWFQSEQEVEDAWLKSTGVEL